MRVHRVVATADLDLVLGRKRTAAETRHFCAQVELTAATMLGVPVRCEPENHGRKPGLRFELDRPLSAPLLNVVRMVLEEAFDAAVRSRTPR